MTAEPLLKLAAKLLTKHRLDAVLIGNAAAALNGAPVTTMDLDFFFRATPGSLRKLRLIAEDLHVAVTQPYYPGSMLYRLSRPEDNLQFDFMPRISGVRSFEGVRARATVVQFGGNDLRVATLVDVIRSKEAADRPEDRAIMPTLKRTVKERQAFYGKKKRRRSA
jgi:predicted nucleotidyltransferase